MTPLYLKSSLVYTSWVLSATLYQPPPRPANPPPLGKRSRRVTQAKSKSTNWGGIKSKVPQIRIKILQSDHDQRSSSIVWARFVENSIHRKLRESSLQLKPNQTISAGSWFNCNQYYKLILPCHNCRRIRARFWCTIKLMTSYIADKNRYVLVQTHLAPVNNFKIYFVQLQSKPNGPPRLSICHQRVVHKRKIS